MSFDFEKLEVYTYAKELYRDILKFLKEHKKIDSTIRDQLKRAALSIVLNIAEGSGRFSKPDKKHFYTIARGSTYESAAVFDILLEENKIQPEMYQKFYQQLERISKMLLGLIHSQQEK